MKILKVVVPILIVIGAFVVAAFMITNGQILNELQGERYEGKKAAAISVLQSVASYSVMYPDQHGFTHDGFCESVLEGKDKSYSCNQEKDNWAVSTKIGWNSYVCIDSVAYKAKEITAPLMDRTSCS